MSLHPSGLALVQAANGFATRLDAIRSLSYTAGQRSTPLPRRTRGRVLDEPLGGPSSPLIELGGKVELALGPEVGHRLWPIALEEDSLYLREDTLTGFEPSVTYENGRLPVGDGDSIPMVQLRGPGTVVASVPEEIAALEVTEGRSTAVRAVAVLGWLGRVVPRGLLPSEAPGASARLRSLRRRRDGPGRWPLITLPARPPPCPRGACARTAAARSGRTPATCPTCSRSSGC